jgi:tetratricopeptide (TPR) repeat protein
MYNIKRNQRVFHHNLLMENKLTRERIKSNVFTLLLVGILGFSLTGCVAERMRNKIESWHQLRATGEVSLDKKDYASAQKSFNDALKIAEGLNSQPVRQAISLVDLSRVCMPTDNVPLAGALTEQALSLANKRSQIPRKQSDELESELAQCLYNSAGVLAKARQYDQAAIAYREARAMFVDLYQRSPVNASNLIIGFYLAQTIDNLGISYKELGQLKEARQAYLTVKDGSIVNGIPYFLKAKLVSDFCQIPDTSRDDKQKYAVILGCKLPQT